MKFKGLLLFCLLGLQYSCSEPKYHGFSETDSGLYYKLHVLGEEERRPSVGGHVIVRYSVRALKDSIQTRTAWKVDTILVSEHMEDGSIKEAVSMLVEGDSATLIFDQFNADYEPISRWGFSDSLLAVELNMFKVQTEEEYQNDQDYLSWRHDQEMNEQIRLNQYLESSTIDERNYIQGMYYIPIKQGRGKKVRSGNVLWVHYKGFFLDGRQFDSTYEMGEPFEFDMGEQDQIIKGLEVGLLQMREKGKAKFIIPSQLAFGESGSSTGIVPPFTSLIYEVELINLK